MSEFDEIDVSEIFSHTQDMVLDAIAANGLPGIEKLVNDLAVEAEAANILGQEIRKFEDEEEPGDVILQNLAGIIELVGFIDELKLEEKMADRRHVFATKLFHAAKVSDWDYFYGFGPGDDND